eukprot:7080407-Prorocentrum_lima.AAC.1
MRGGGEPMTRAEWWKVVQETREVMAERDYSAPITQEMFQALEKQTQAGQRLTEESLSDGDSTDPDELADPTTEAAAKPRAWPAWHRIAHIPVQHRPHSKYFDIRSQPPAPGHPRPAGWHTKALPPPQVFGPQR